MPDFPPLDFSVYDSGDIVCPPGRPDTELRIFAITWDRMTFIVEKDGGLSCDDLILLFSGKRGRRLADDLEEGRLQGLGTHRKWAWIWNHSDSVLPWLVRPVKWRVGDEVEDPDLKEELAGIWKVRKRQGKNVLAYNNACQSLILGTPEEEPSFVLRSREGVCILQQRKRPPCIDCGGSGVYVGFTERKACPSCSGKTINLDQGTNVGFFRYKNQPSD